MSNTDSSGGVDPHGDTVPVPDPTGHTSLPDEALIDPVIPPPPLLPHIPDATTMAMAVGVGVAAVGAGAMAPAAAAAGAAAAAAAFIMHSIEPPPKMLAQEEEQGVGSDSDGEVDI